MAGDRVPLSRGPRAATPESRLAETTRLILGFNAPRPLLQKRDRTGIVVFRSVITVWGNRGPKTGRGSPRSSPFSGKDSNSFCPPLEAASPVLLMSLPQVEKPRLGSLMNRVGLGSKGPRFETSPPVVRSGPNPIPGLSLSFLICKTGSVSQITLLTPSALKCPGDACFTMGTQIRPRF